MVKPAVQFTQQVFTRDFDIIEKQLSGVLALEPHLVHIVAALKAFHATLYYKQRESVWIIGVRTCGNNNEISEDPVRNEGLRSIEQEVVALVLGLGANG